MVFVFLDYSKASLYTWREILYRNKIRRHIEGSEEIHQLIERASSSRPLIERIASSIQSVLNVKEIDDRSTKLLV